ncbi:hypothetical protein CROQUDRAFT_666403 [Cronartium quercuum f. sp. fusiforme G11]|uniref:Uncharacterized protein n=1 Tax=Cronartium quercuum f. sp. fusiforme G11 TaxID=708437 RepID=A0A9P6N5C4_9BASI|nr:hypothetical protein CROQUDRAFT_666403 [Cronartium quercuum f. sp. fusiforme G11]
MTIIIKSMIIRRIMRKKSNNQRFIHRKPTPSPFFESNNNSTSTNTTTFSSPSDYQDLTNLPSNAPIPLQIEAFKMYNKCNIFNKEPILRLAIIRQMRNFDFPPHKDLYQKITKEDEMKLLNWIDESFISLLYYKKLWKPYKDWNLQDDLNEHQIRTNNLNLIKNEYQEQIIKPLKLKYNQNIINDILKNLNQSEFKEPATIWESNQLNQIEWMSEKTCDILWPGLFNCQEDHLINRRYWESVSRQFSKLNGGFPRGMSSNEIMLDLLNEIGEPVEIGIDDKEEGDDQVKKVAEELLMKQFLEERQ